MPLLSEFSRYVDWGADAERWDMMLYNRPISMGVGYSINNLKGRKMSITDKNADGFLKRKLKSKAEENEKQFWKVEILDRLVMNGCL